MSRKGISIIIPNWNGRHLLEKNLPLLTEALTLYSGETEIIVVDDGSTDGSGDFLKTSYPDIKVLSSPANEGFSAACNRGVMAGGHEIIYLMNNDIRVQADFLEPLTDHFKDDTVFAVSSIAYPPDKSVSSAPAVPLVRFKYGIFWYYYKTITDTGKPISVFFSSGGHSAYDRTKFIELGAFDNLYHPFYWEDADISYRAWKRGWKSLYEPKSRVIHDHQSTIAINFKKEFIQNIHWRNRFLFTWKNLNTGSLWGQHLFFLPLELMLMPFIGRIHFTKGFFMALKRLKDVFKRRNIRVRDTLTDRQVLDIFKNG